MSLAIDVRHRLGDFQLEASFETEGHLTALFGRSGSGKTSLVNIIAGLVRPDHGRVVVNGDALVDTARGIYVPRHRRRVGYVFQEGRLFPHLTVRQNLLYGRWFTPHAERREGLDHIVEMLGIGALLDRRPAGLSGGEKQRVAIGRALLASPRLLLMDEPLASLDEARKSEILPYIERLRDETRIPIVYVSHSVPEVARLATTMVLLSNGKVSASGTVGDVMGRLDLFPLTGRHEAGAILDMEVASLDERYGLATLQSRAGALRVPLAGLQVGTRLRVHIRARDVMIGLSAPEDLSALNVLRGTIAQLGVADGPIVDLRLDLSGDTLLARVTRLTVDRLGLAPGRPVFAIIKSVALDRRSLGRSRPAGAEPAGPLDEILL
jgi:molybdate transport system ATP-binding protein